MSQLVKNPSAMQETWVRSRGWEVPLEKVMAVHSSILAWRTHGRRSLVGYSPQGGKESDMTLGGVREREKKKKDEAGFYAGKLLSLPRTELLSA